MAVYHYKTETLKERGFKVGDEFALPLSSDGRMYVERGIYTQCGMPLPVMASGVSTHREISGGGLTKPLVVCSDYDVVKVFSEWDCVLLGDPDKATDY